MNLTERRPNVMQRVFDCIVGEMKSIAAIAASLHIPEDMVTDAIHRLRRQRCTKSAFDGAQWLYGIKPDSERPSGYQGRKRR